MRRRCGQCGRGLAGRRERGDWLAELALGCMDSPAGWRRWWDWPRCRRGSPLCRRGSSLGLLPLLPCCCPRGLAIHVGAHRSLGVGYHFWRYSLWRMVVVVAEPLLRVWFPPISDVVAPMR